MNKFSDARFCDRKTQPSMFTLVLLASISMLAMNSFLPSLPAMAIHFDTTVAIMGVSVAIYLGSSAVIQILVGPLSDRIGRRPVLLWSLGIFIFASFACIFAQNIAVFMTLRAVQAFAACGMVLSRAIVRDTSDAQASASKIAYIAMGMAITPMVAPALGGFLDSWFGWKSNFWMIGGVGLIVWIVTYFDQGETAPSSTVGWHKQIKEYPELLASRRFWGYCLTSAFAAGAYFAYLGGGPFVGSDVFNLSPEKLGLYFGTPAIGYFVGNFISGRYSLRLSIDYMILIGLIAIFIGVSLSMFLSFFGQSSAMSFFGCLIFVGFGNGLCLPNATAGMLSVRPHLAGAASGLGGSISIAGGAGLSTLAGLVLAPGSTEMPLLILMWASSLLGLITALLVQKLNKKFSLNA